MSVRDAIVVAIVVTVVALVNCKIRIVYQQL